MESEIWIMTFIFNSLIICHFCGESAENNESNNNNLCVINYIIIIVFSLFLQSFFKMHSNL